MGTPEFAVPSFLALLDAGYSVAAAVTAPDRPRGRGLHVLPTPVKSVALGRGIPVLEPPALRDPAFAADLRALGADLFVVVAFRILPVEVFTLPPLGSFNLHASLLPKYRGAAPINWAIINGETETGVTTFFLREKVDTGAMLLQRRVPIGPDDDAGALHDRLAQVGAEVVLGTVRAIERGEAVPLQQDDAGATPAPKIFRDDCRIRWDAPAAAVVNRIRGLSPSPGAFTTHAGRVLKIFRAVRTDTHGSSAPGVVVVEEGRIMAGTGEGAVELRELQQEGRKRMGAGEFLRGYPLASGDRLG
jgi:methionyl-tRNA formyltransferase